MLLVPGRKGLPYAAHQYAVLLARARLESSKLKQLPLGIFRATVQPYTRDGQANNYSFLLCQV